MHDSIFTSSRGTDDYSSKSRPSSHGPTLHHVRAWPKRYETSSDVQALATDTEGILMGSNHRSERSRQKNAYIMRTIDVDARSAPTAHDGFSSVNNPGQLWQGQGVYDAKVRV